MRKTKPGPSALTWNEGLWTPAKVIVVGNPSMSFTVDAIPAISGRKWISLLRKEGQKDYGLSVHYKTKWTNEWRQRIYMKYYLPLHSAHGSRIAFLQGQKIKVVATDDFQFEGHPTRREEIKEALEGTPFQLM